METRAPVLIKQPRQEYPGPAELRRMNVEQQFFRTLHLDCLPRFIEARSDRRGSILIFSKPQGVLLTAFTVAPLAPVRFLRIAGAITQAVADLHNASVVHRSINPSSVLYDESVRKCTFLDLTGASRLSRLNREVEKSTSLHNYAYMAPEQTGRLNRSVDHRADLYSIGIVLYELLTARKPFHAATPADWVHNHIAREIPRLDRNDVPPVFGKILRKLTAKSAEDRYQSALGLLEDINRCLIEMERKAEVTDFEPGLRDVSARLHVSEKSYGREGELDQLRNAFAEVSGGNIRIALISGPPGVGKTALIGELQKTLSLTPTIFANGKFEQFERHTPFRAWIGACRSLIKRIEAEIPGEIPELVKILKDRLGSNLPLIISVVPELASWTGQTPPVTELGAVESRNRFMEAFLGFISIFSNQERPLILFLDDLQWADTASLDLIKALAMGTDVEGILILLTSRDSGLESLSSFSLTLEELRKQKVFSQITLNPLRRNDVGALIADSLLLTQERTVALTDSIYHQTDGNPLYVTQLLHSLHNEGTLYFDQGAARWLWNESRLRELGQGVDLADFLAKKIGALGENTRGVLAAAGCLGHQFSFEILAAVSGFEREAVEEALSAAINEGLLIAEAKSSSIGAGSQTLGYSFMHDRVQHACHQLSTSEERARLHLAAATFLKPTAFAEADSIFILVQHLVQAQSLITADSERYEAASFSLRAAHSARLNASWDVALENSLAAIRFLSQNSWNEEYDLTYAVYREALENEYLNGNYERAEELFSILRKETRNTLELVRIYEQLVVLYTNMGRHGEAIKIGLQGLKMINIALPASPSVPRILLEVARVKIIRHGMAARDILDKPQMSDPRLLAAMDLLLAITPCAFFINQNLFGLIVLKMTGMSLKHGNSKVSAYAFMTYGVLLIDAFGQYAEAAQFGKAALELNDRFDNVALRSKLGVVFGAFINHWDGPISKNVVYLRRAFRAGLETGDLVYAGYALANRIFASGVRGDSLAECDRQAASFMRFTERTGDRDVEGDFILSIQASCQMRGKTLNDSSFSDSSYKEEQHLQQMQTGNPVTLCWYYFLKIRNAYLLRNPKEAVLLSRTLRLIIQPAMPLVIGPAAVFFEGLALCSLKNLGLAYNKSRLNKIIKTHATWARTPGMHFQARYHLLLAENLSSTKSGDALTHYSQAIRAAAEDEDRLTRAIASELAGRFALRLGVPEASERYLRDALYYFEQWGADRKVEILKNEFSYLSDKLTPDPEAMGTMDMRAITRTAIAISSEIVQVRLVERVLELMMIQAGARKIAYLHDHDGHLCVAAIGTTEVTIVIDVMHEPSGTTPFPPMSVIRHVMRTRENVVIADASKDERFDIGADERPVRSVLCTPVILKGKIAGIIYLENDLTAGVFNEERLEILSVLSAQFAVSLENSNLYANLESRVLERTRELEKSLGQVHELKMSQDMDYYLTSLLLQPLSGIRASDSRLSPQYFVSQKKKFHYMRWDEQLGGDICIARSIRLRGQNYLALTNADAMGKSMQGAGGALVFGAVFESIIASTQEGTDPEEWLKACYADLNEVFRSFNGYMMVSAFIGLIEEHSGILFSVNADHPQAVLYRSGRATFLNQPIHLRIGMRIAPQQIEVHKVILERDDILIAASDGRDDVIVSDSKGQPTLNEDPDRFLEIVEECHGDPETIYRFLDSGDRLTDDFSIISVKLGPLQNQTTPDYHVSTSHESERSPR
ncbi:MAG: AAA family ATPase [Spirochaetia bacterium]|nr:AAA family ATPase [Spirochaetia bacterium]